MAVLKFDKKIYTGKWKQRINGYIGNSNIPYRDIFAQWIGNGKCVDFSNFNISTFSYPNSQSRRVVKMGFLGTAWALLKIVNFFHKFSKNFWKISKLENFSAPKVPAFREIFTSRIFSWGHLLYRDAWIASEKRKCIYLEYEWPGPLINRKF